MTIKIKLTRREDLHFYRSIEYDNQTRKKSIDRGIWNILFIDSTSTDVDDGDAGGEDNDTIETIINSISSFMFLEYCKQLLRNLDSFGPTSKKRRRREAIQIFM